MKESTVTIPMEWRQAVEEIALHGGPVVVLSEPGAGCDVFSQYLSLAVVRKGGRVAWIDGDPGLPCFGPPAALSLTIHAEPADPSRKSVPHSLYFIGDPSPTGHLPAIISGIRKLADLSAARSSDLLLLNASAMTRGGAGRELVFHEVDLLSPRHLVAIQRDKELEHVLAPHAFHAGLLTLRLPRAADTHPLTREASAVAREQRFREYFRGAQFQELAFNDAGIYGPGLGTGERLGFRDVNRLSNLLQAIVVHAELSTDRLFVVTDGEYSEESLFGAKEHYGVRELSVFRRSDFDHLLVGLNDNRNLCMGMGILREADFREQVFRLITPLKDTAAVRHLSLGSLRISPAGKELGRW